MSETREETASRRHLFPDQLSGVIVDTINQARHEAEVSALSTQDNAFRIAVEQIDKVRVFLGDPSKILGNPSTKHGEIAEHVEVGIRNARSALEQMNMTAAIDVPRLGPVDYILDGNGVQSKFVNGIPNNLKHVLDHLGDYKGFTNDGSYYIVPKDTYENIQTILNGGHVEGLRGTTEDSIKALVSRIEEETGKSFSEAVRPSVSNYDDIQQGTVTKTLENEQSALSERNGEIKDKIIDDHKPTLAGAAQAALVGGAVGGALSLATALYGKYKDGKNPFKGDFTAEDWKSVGINTALGAGGGAVASGSIYLMTNYAGMSAPFAAAVVSAAKGVYSLVGRYRRGEIGFNEFVDLGMIVCSESAIVGAATMVGQTLIPIPIVGAVVGSLAGKLLSEFVTSQSEVIAERLRKDMEAFKATLDSKLRSLMDTITSEFDKIASLTEIAFDLDHNMRLLKSSVELAIAYGVPTEQIIADEAALDSFMLS